MYMCNYVFHLLRLILKNNGNTLHSVEAYTIYVFATIKRESGIVNDLVEQR